MIRDASPLVQSLLGSLLTWGLTALGAAGVYCVRSDNRRLLDGSLGFAAGVMMAASFWSLLAPALELAEASQPEGYAWLAFAPVTIGLLAGAAFVYAADVLLSRLGLDEDPHTALMGYVGGGAKQQKKHKQDTAYASLVNDTGGLRQRRPKSADVELLGEDDVDAKEEYAKSWHRILLLLLAIVAHNIPEGLVVGVAFAAIGSAPSATFESAVSLAIGIGIQNFPEGLAVSLPLAAFGTPRTTAFMYGQASGMVEPIAAVLGALLVTAIKPLLPYALAGAGAMIYVVFDDIIPETHRHQRTASWGAMAGFCVMMALDTSLG